MTPNEDKAERHWQKWLIKARQGDVDSLGNLLEGFRQVMLHVAEQELATDLRPKVGASDLVQQAMLEGIRDFREFRGNTPEELRAWLLSVLHHTVLNLYRDYRETAKRDIHREFNTSDSVLDQLTNKLAPAQETPSFLAIQHEERTILLDALARLPEHYRTVIEMRHRDHFSFEKIGELQNRSPDAVRMQWTRAIEALHRELHLSASGSLHPPAES